MATRMLIDARHPEETRVAVLKGNRIDEFDFESADRKQIKGNIYLAKVTRVEPSLQAAFVDFGGNRHGFLAFSEIHPDYYQIPKEDREALLAEEAAHAEEEAALRADDEDEDGDTIDDDINADTEDDSDDDDDDQPESDSQDSGDADSTEGDSSEDASTENDGAEEAPESEGDGEESEAESDARSSGRPRRRGRSQGRGQNRGRGRSKEADDLRSRRMALRRRYKIQDVIQRRQVLLVQVVKEERGNKGAALTSYLSLAGRYCVLMPNSSHGGGISRKINSSSDRKRLKAIIKDMALPKSMGCIVRTAGLSRTKTEIKRNFDYLSRLWDELRERTLGSSAPKLIHTDSDLIKRAIRDIYNREIEEVIVEGEEGYRAAKDFMKLLMPSHARRVKPYSDPVPLFQRYGAEDQLTAMYDPEVQLKSGGYIVINPTEALVSIDINSGRSTKEHGIEATALNTNIEAAREVARQLRLRDMAGLVVIDFIDMENVSNVRKVERAMKDALKNDRARIQVGRISSFGLMEMSRQRLRTGVLEATTRECPHCDGTGLVRTASSAGLSALRQIEDEAAKDKGSVISLFASTEAAIYLLNSKRADLADIELRYAVSVEVVPEGENEGAKMRVTSSGPRPTNIPVFQPIVDDTVDDDIPMEEDEDETAAEAEENEDGPRRKRRRRGGRGRGRDREGQASEGEGQASEGSGEETSDRPAEGSDETSEDEDAPRKRKRRGRRRRGRDRGAEGESLNEGETSQDQTDGAATSDASEPDGNSDSEAAQAAEPEAAAPETAEPETVKKTPKPRTRRKATPAAETENADTAEAAEEAPKPKRTRRKKTEDKAEPASSDAAPVSEKSAPPAKPKTTRRKKAVAEEAAAEPATTEEAPAKPKRTRRKKADAPTAEAPAEQPATLAEAKPAEVPQAAPVSAPTSQAGDTSGSTGGDNEDGSARRGWWQRTFGE